MQNMIKRFKKSVRTEMEEFNMEIVEIDTEELESLTCMPNLEIE